MKKAVIMRKAISLLFCVPFIIILTLCFICTIRNNQLLEKFSNQLYTYELPDDTEIIETHSLCGNLFGRKSSMDYAAAMLIKTDQSIDQIRSYYFSADFDSIDKGMVKPALEIVRLEEEKMNPYYISNESLHFSEIEREENQGEYIAIVMTDTGHQSFFDLRSKAD